MTYQLRTIAAASCFVALGACTVPPPTKVGSGSPLVGTWAEIVTTSPANATDGRQVIQRFEDGTFKLVFVKTHPTLTPCAGTWSKFGNEQRLVFTSLSCFSSGAPKPPLGNQLNLEIIESSPTRLKFKVPEGAPLASWQARLESGIE